MKIKVFTNNPWQENTIVLYDETGEAVIIDCGCFSKEEGQRLKSFLVENQLIPVALLIHICISIIFSGIISCWMNLGYQPGRMRRIRFG